MSMAQDLFKVGPGAGPQPTCAWHFEKYLGPRQHSPKEGHLRRQANNLTSPKRVKAWGDSPTKARGISSAKTHPNGTTQLTPQPAEVRPNNWRGAPNTWVWLIQKITISQETSDRKCNLLWPENIGFLAPKRRNSCSDSDRHFNWEHS